jgi:hypothetical protein
LNTVPLLLPLDPVPLLLPLLLAPPSSVPDEPVPCVSPPQATAPITPAGTPTVTMSANNLSNLAVVTPRMRKSYAPDRLCTRPPLV